MAEHDHDTYDELAHAVLTGVSYQLEHDPKAGTPKHLVHGNNMRAADQCALVCLLIEKGVFTEEEYRQAIRDELQREVERYEKMLAEKYETEITLR